MHLGSRSPRFQEDALHETVNSPWFVAAGVDLQMRLWPTGAPGASPGWSSLYVVSTPGTFVTADLMLGGVCRTVRLARAASKRSHLKILGLLQNLRA